MRLFINSLAASAGGGLTYIRSVLPILARRKDVQVTVSVGSDLRREFGDLPNVEFVEMELPVLRRFWYEQFGLRPLLHRSNADVLLSTGNFAVRNSPIPQILLSRNSVYTSADYYRDLWTRHQYFLWTDTHFRGWLARKSIAWADVTIAPSEAFATELLRWTGRPVRGIHHGFDADAFTANHNPLAPDMEQKLQNTNGSLKLLFVSHYNYYRNFETLFRALPILRQRLGKPVSLLLTCKLRAEETPGAYRPESAAKLVRDLGVGNMVVELGTVPYTQLHKVYRRADIYVSPAYTETFAHPLVEAMASGLPIVASDLAVHREICQDSAVYFPCFSPEALAEAIAQIAVSPDVAKRLGDTAAARSRAFSWRKHVDAILEIANALKRSSRVDEALQPQAINAR